MINKIKSIEELYEEVKDFELVITNDAPLNTALNKTLNKAQLGSFALTSKLIGTKYSDYLFEEEQLSLPEIVLIVQKDFKLSLKEALYYVKNIMTVWQHTGNLEEAKIYLSNKEKNIVDLLMKTPTYQLSMEKMDLSFLEKTNIVTIGKEVFNELDKKVLTLPHIEISPFRGHEHKLDTFYLFNSQNDIIDRVVSMINKENQNGIAIVLNIESEYLPLIKARLINNGIELNEKLFLFQEFRIREYLAIIETFYSMHNVYTKELIPIGNILNIDIDQEQGNSLFLELSKINKNAEKLYNTLQDLKKKTFGELVKEIEKYELVLPYEFTEMLNKLELYNETITKKKFLELKYFIENFEKEIEINKTGVLLIDAKNSTYINRDIIFYLGMDHSWTKTIENQKYVDKEVELEKNIKRFEILIQQGKERFFFMPKFSDGTDTIPPFYFNFLFGANVEKYSSEHFDIKEINNIENNKKYENTPNSNSAEIKDKETISNSRLNNLSQCPKKYAYSTLVSTLDKEVFLKGNLVHAFAEFYVNHQDFVKDKKIDEFVDLIMSNLKLMSNPFQNSIDKTKIKFACEAIISFIDELEIDSKINFESFKEISRKNQENIFAIHYKKPMEKPNAELEFKDLDLKLNGIIDLAVNNDLIVDYKTSKDKKKIIDIVRNSNIEKIVSKCDFQPLVYLSVFRKINPGKKIQFWYNFPMTDIYEKIVQKEVDDNNVKVHYIPTSFDDYVKTDNFKEHFSELLGKDAKEMFIEFNSIEYFENMNLNEIISSNIDKFIEENQESFYQYHLDKGMKTIKKYEKASPQLLKYILTFKLGGKIGRYGQKEAFFFKDDLDNFEKYVEQSLKKVNTYSNSNFPYEPVDGENTCKNCDFKRICLKKEVLN